MPSAKEAAEKLNWMVTHGRADEKVHIVFVEQDQKERIKNEKRKTRFCIETHDPDLCADFEREKDRIVRRCERNMSIALGLMIRAFRDALTDATIDRIMAEMERL